MWLGRAQAQERDVRPLGAVFSNSKLTSSILGLLGKVPFGRRIASIRAFAFSQWWVRPVAGNISRIGTMFLRRVRLGRAFGRVALLTLRLLSIGLPCNILAIEFRIPLS